MALQPPFEIPTITEQRLFELAARFQPLLQGPAGFLLMDVPLDSHALRNTSYAWVENPKGSEAKGMKEVATFKTLHTYGYYGMFKPSVAEVLAQLPPEFANREGRFAFSVDGPSTADDLNDEHEAVNAGFHVATTTLYELEPKAQSALDRIIGEDPGP